MSTRRTALQSIVAAAVALPGAAQHQPGDASIGITGSYVPKTLDAAQMKNVATLVDLIIPRTDTPGASDACVHEYIDRTLSRNAARKELFLAGLRQFETLDGLTQDDRIALLNRTIGTPFFRLLKDLTIDGYYTSKEGLTRELGWNANTFVAEFKGCTHPEHQS